MTEINRDEAFIGDLRVERDVNAKSMDVERVFLGEQNSAPTDAEIGTGNVAFYSKTDGNLYRKPHGGTESQVGGGSSVLTDSGSDNASGGDIYQFPQSTDSLDLRSDGRLDIGPYQFDYRPPGNNHLRIFQSGTGTNMLLFKSDDRLRMQVPFDLDGNALEGASTTEYTPQDVRNISSPAQGWVAYHDGSGTNTEGPAHYNGTNWISTVDGTTIS